MTAGDNVPSIELLNSAHQFPGPYVFKAIGKQDNAFVARVIAAIREELELTVDPAHELRTSAKGNHAAVTVTVRVQSAEQVRAVYYRILKLPGLEMLF